MRGNFICGCAVVLRVYSPICLGLVTAIALPLFVADPVSAQVRDNRDYCRDSGRVVLLLVDATTPYDSTDKSVIVRMADDILRTAVAGDKIVVRTIADSHARSERLIEQCVPGCFETGAFGKLFKCSDGVIRTDSQYARESIIGALRARLSKFRELGSSDIVRTIYYTVKEEAREEKSLSLYIYSDLIENSDYFASRYIFSYSLDRLIYGIKHYNLIASLTNADVHVAGIGRDGTPDRKPLPVAKLNKLTEFWKAYFEAGGARFVTITPDIIETKR